ncbi:hypothetical protein M5C90_17955 [Pseudomonas chlororaphis subsp. piscium]|nr:hypothetical protein M5C90_17955 [Pseudomonas chlororaphis subsp. piscium]
MVARNLMVAGVASGLAQNLFTLDSRGGNLWQNEGRNGTLFHVWMPHDIPALGWVSDIGFGELSIHIACWPNGENIRNGQVGFWAGEAVSSGWLEREQGKWIMNDYRGGITLNVRRRLQKKLAECIAPTSGFSDFGTFFL